MILLSYVTERRLKLLNLVSLKGTEEFTIHLYKESIKELQDDLEIVKNDTTKALILEEIKLCNKRINEISNY